jgi:hypothetical protein
MCMNFATCYHFLDLSDQTVRDDNSVRHVQGSNAPCESSRIQIMLQDSQSARF